MMKQVPLKLTLLNILVILALMSKVALGYIADMDKYRLPEMVLVKKQDFLFEKAEGEGA